MASLVDSTANAEVEIKAIKISVLAGTPAAPLTIAGGMAVSGNFTVVANPNGGGPGVPLSVWTNGNVDLTNGSGQTCHQGDYSGGCSAYISQHSPLIWSGICSMKMTTLQGGPIWSREQYNY